MNRSNDDPVTLPFADGPPAKISVVSPCFHEEEGIEAFYTRLKHVLVQDCPGHDHEIVLVDDGSRDATLERLQKIEERDDCVRVFSLTRNMGHQIALSAGLDVSDGDVTIVLDSDLQHPPELIPEMVQKWHEGYDVVLGVRKQTEDASLFKRLSSDGFYSVFNFLSDVKLTPGAADFCLLSRTALNGLRQMPERRRFLRGMIAWMGFKTARVSYTAPSRFAGESKYSLRRMLALALDATFSFSTRPIRLASKAGALFVVVGMMYLAYVLGRYFIVGDLLPGWASIVGTILLMGGVQLLSIGLIGEYLAHVFEEVKGRPQYLFKYTPELANQAAATGSSPRDRNAAGQAEVSGFATQGEEKCA